MASFTRLLPAWLVGYERGWLRADFFAGLTVMALLIPEGMAYAQLAGVPPEAAFYAAPAALLLYALLGSSRQLVVAVSSGIAITSAATVSELSTPGTAEYITLTAGLAVLAGLVSMAAGILRLGRVARVFSSSVLLGFVFGLSLIISVKQVPKILGVELHETRFFMQIVEIIGRLADTHFATLAVGLGSGVSMVLLHRFTPKLPAALVVLVGSIIASVVLNLSSHGVAVVGVLPSGLESPQLPGLGWSAVPVLGAGAVGIALLAFAEAMGPGNQLAKKHGYRLNANRELVAIGAANAGAGLFQGFPIGASLSKSAANDRAGARTPMSLVVAAATTALVALFLTPMFRELPEAALAAIVIVAVSEMERIAPVVRLWHVRRSDGVVALVALVGVLVVGILAGLVLAVLLSLVLIVWRAGEGRLEILGGNAPKRDDAPTPALRVARPLQMLFFANAEEVQESILAALHNADSPPDVVVLDLALTSDLDVPSLDMLTSLRESLAAQGTKLWLVTQLEDMLARLARGGYTKGPASADVFPNVTAALLAYLSLHSAGGLPGVSPVLAELRDAIRERRSDPRLDASARQVLDEISERLDRER